MCRKKWRDNFFCRTSKQDLQKLYNVIKGVEQAEFVKEYPIKNVFKFDDIFNDLSVHTFMQGDEDFIDKMTEPDYTDCDTATELMWSLKKKIIGCKLE